MFLAAAVQMTSTEDKARNLATAEKWVGEAASRGARLVGLPENFSFMGADADKSKMAEPLTGPTLGRMAELAHKKRIYLLAGSVLESGAPGGRFYNTSVLFSPEGKQIAVYRKMHLFDVQIPDGATYRESAAVAPGTDVVTPKTELCTMGLSVCYDLRFPELFRRHAKAGAELLWVPAAFTYMTGKDHWEVLLRARAIENQAFVVAPAQVGQHAERRQTWGHAMIIDPWGHILAQVQEGEGVAVAEIDLKMMAKVRRELPALTHRVLE
jgi:predicted amidohydrolase